MRQKVSPLFKNSIIFIIFLVTVLSVLYQLNPWNFYEFSTFVANSIANSLRPIGESLRAFLLTIPLWFAKGLFILYYASILVWVLLKDKSQVQGEIPGRKKPFDVRPLVITSLGALILVYIIF